MKVPVKSTASARSLFSARAPVAPSIEAKTNASPIRKTTLPDLVARMQFSPSARLGKSKAREPRFEEMSVHAHRHEVVLDGVGDGRVAAVGERQRCAVGAEHGKEVDAFWRGLQRREQPLGDFGIELLDVSHLAVAKLRELAPAHGRARQAIFFFELVHRRLLLLTRRWRGTLRCHATSLHSAAAMPTFSTFFSLRGRSSSMAR